MAGGLAYMAVQCDMVQSLGPASNGSFAILQDNWIGLSSITNSQVSISTC